MQGMRKIATANDMQRANGFAVCRAARAATTWFWPKGVIAAYSAADVSASESSSGAAYVAGESKSGPPWDVSRRIHLERGTFRWATRARGEAK